MRTVTLLGSTGSIGTQALEVIRENREDFVVHALACGSNVELLTQQTKEFSPVCIASAQGSREGVLRALANAGVKQIPEIIVGKTAATQLAQRKSDVVLNGMTGAVGLEPTLATLHAGNTLALANKESLIIGGELVKQAAQPGQIIPVDSEHSALAQCLLSTHRPLQPFAASEVQRLVLTASGGPFRGKSLEELEKVTPQEALAHPTWDMGRVVTTNSASLVNKGLEVIEAHLLFDVPLENIDVVVHPQSVVHSMVEFKDGSTIAQCSPPDMKLPIALGLSWPERTPRAATPCDWTQATQWTFEPLDEHTFPAVQLAKQAAIVGKTMPAVLNAANEEAVDAFHDGKISFPQIMSIISAVIAGHTVAQEMTLSSVLEADAWARKQARTIIADK